MTCVALLARWVAVAGLFSALAHQSVGATIVAVIGFGLAARAARIERSL